MKYQDLTGETFLKLTVLKRVPNPSGKRGVYWLCECECGNTSIVFGGNLKRFHTTSCGCNLATTGGHRVKNTLEYVSWSGMKTRCLNSEASNYRYYGGKGITICPEWLEDFKIFLKDMGPRPSKQHTIDRRDNQGNYEPGNCYWATKSQQAYNRKRA